MGSSRHLWGQATEFTGQLLSLLDPGLRYHGMRGYLSCIPNPCRFDPLCLQDNYVSQVQSKENLCALLSLCDWFRRDHVIRVWPMRTLPRALAKTLFFPIAEAAKCLSGDAGGHVRTFVGGSSRTESTAGQLCVLPVWSSGIINSAFIQRTLQLPCSETPGHHRRAS